MRYIGRMAAALAFCGLASGCREAAAPADPAVRLEIVSGDEQEAVSPAYGYLAIGQGMMPESLRVRVTDLAGEPIAGRTVAWTTRTGGSVTPATSVTDAAGFAATRWWLYGPPTSASPSVEAGVHQVWASLADGQAVAFTGHVRTGIRIDELTITPDTVDVGSGPASVTVSLRVHDDRRTTTLSYGSVQFYNPSQTAESFQSAVGALTLASGTPNDGVWSATFRIPADAEPGPWFLGRLVLGWGCGGWNRIELIGLTLTRHGFARNLHVVATPTGVAGGGSAARAPRATRGPSEPSAVVGC